MYLYFLNYMVKVDKTYIPLLNSKINPSGPNIYLMPIPISCPFSKIT